jgi:hypothetical protein
LDLASARQGKARRGEERRERIHLFMDVLDSLGSRLSPAGLPPVR